MRTILILCLSILFLPLTLAAEGLTVTGGAENTDYSYANNVYTVLTGTSLTFSGTTTADRIVIAEGITADITLNDLSIDVSAIDNATAIRLEKKAKLTLHIAGTESTLKSGRSATGIGVSDGCDLHITAESETPKLTVFGGNNSITSRTSGAGIGSNLSEEGKASIRISNGTISATGGTGGDWGKSGDGIGQSGDRKLEVAIIFDGGKITAKGGSQPWAGSAGYGINGNVTVEDGTFINCTFNNTTIESGTFTSCTFNGNIVINGGTFTNCPISGDKVIINKGTINNTDGSRISSKKIIINGGNITVSIPSSNANNAIGDQDCNVTINGGAIIATANSINNQGDPSGAGIAGTVTINGGYITTTAPGRNGAGIGGYGSYIGGTFDKNDTKSNKPITITGGTIIASGGSAGIGSGPGVPAQLITITGGTITAKGTYWNNHPVGIGSGHENGTSDGIIITGGSIKSTFKDALTDDKTNTVYLGITPEIANATDVSVDGIPYYISGNHPENDNKLYLYMIGTTHKVAIRTNDNITTYDVEYNPLGNNNDGYFNFKNKAESTLSETSKISFDPNDITTTYNKGSNELTVTLTITETPIKSRSAAMNSVQLTLTDEAGNYIESNRQTVTGSDKYTFTFDTQGLDVGNYTLTANYGGSATSLTADEQTKTLTIEKATPIYIIPSGLSVTYGKTLADINLPDGWAWNASETSVGNVSSSPKTFAATFTPADTKNYNTVVENLSITVNKAEASDPENPVVTSPSPVTYGAKLSDIIITDDWQWEDGTIVPTVTNFGYMAYYPVTDYDNYDWNKINGYDEASHRVRRSVSVTVNKADLSAIDFTFTAPSDLVYNGSAKAATVTAKDGLIGVGSITLKYYKENVATATDPIEVGNYTVKINVDGGNNYNDVIDLEVGKFSIIPKQYAIGIDPAIANGTVTADKTQAIEGETVTLTVTPAQGYEQETLFYTTDGGTTETITGTTFVMPAADVTVTATFKASSVPPVNPPVIPDDPDDPAPVRYTVTLPTVEGAATDPAAGNYEVEEWDSFSFLLTLDEGYQKDSQPVVTARGKTLTPNASTGKYIIPNVQSYITVGISGIVKDVATGNESLTDGFHITTSGGLLLVTVPRATRLYLTDTSGRLILSRLLPAGDTRIDDLAAGVYLLTLEGEKTKKIIIR